MKEKLLLIITILVFLLGSLFYFFSNESRIDIVNCGKDSIDVQILSKHRQIVTFQSDNIFTIQIPNSIFFKKEKLKINIKECDKAEILFKAPRVSYDFRINDKYTIQPESFIDIGRVSVEYKNILINGNKVKCKSKKASGTKFIKYTVDVGPNGDIDIEFFHKLLPNYKVDVLPFFSFFAVVAIILFLCIKYKDRDWLNCIVEWYKRIDGSYKKAFWTIFVVTNVVFISHTILMWFGNHSWTFVLKGTNLWDALYMGRYASQFLKVIFFNGQFTPIVTNLLTFAALSFTSLLLCNYWKISKRYYVLVICGLLFSLQPFILEWLFFTEALPDYVIAPIFVILGFMLAEKAYFSNKLSSVFKLNFVAILLINFALGIYPTLVHTIAVLFAGKIFVELLSKNGKLKDILLSKIYVVIDAIIAGVLFKSIIEFLKYRGIVGGFYTIQQLQLSQLPSRIIECIKASFEQLYSYQFPFMPQSLTMIFTLLLIILVFIILSENPYESIYQNIKVKAVNILFLTITIIATKAAMFVCAEPAFFQARMDFFGLLFLRILVVGVILTKINNINMKNFVIALSCFALYISVINDFWAMKVWNLALKSEEMSWNRVLVKLENSRDFDYKKKYNVVRIGPNPSFRQNYVILPLKTRMSLGLLRHTFSESWHPLIYVEAYSKHFVKKGWRYFPHIIETPDYSGINKRFEIDIDDMKSDFYIVMKKLYDDGILQNVLANNEDIVVHGDTILYVTQYSLLEQIVDKLEEYYDKD